MPLFETVAEYADSWSEPEQNPGRAFDIVTEFCDTHPTLDQSLVRQFAAILREKGDRWLPQLLVANVLLRVHRFDRQLMEPMLKAAAEMPDPSANRDFLTPCLYSFGADDVVKWLVAAFATGSTVERIGIANLTYWLRSYPVDLDELRQRKSSAQDAEEWLQSHDIDASVLRTVIATAAASSANLVERYFYSLALPDRQHLFQNVPKDAMELEVRIAGNAEYEHLIYEELGWPRRDTELA